MKRIVPLIIFALLVCQLSHSQEIQLSPTVISSAGNHAEAGDISISWTLGEVAVTTLEQNDIILTQGFQQSFGNALGINKDPILWEISAYPNPVNNELRVQFNVQDSKDFLMEIQDVSGKLLSQDLYKEVFPGDIIPVNMSSFEPGVYFFRISTTDRKQVRVISIRKK